MGRILDAVIAFLDEEGWAYSQIESRPILHMDYKGESGEWACYAHAREEDEQFLFYSALPDRVPESKRLTALEFITRVNYAIAIGNFEMDLDDGEIRFKTSIDAEGSDLQNEMIRQMVYSNVMSMDLFLPGIVEVVNQNASPVAVLARLQADDA